MKSPLTAEQRAQWRDAGFLALPGFVGAGELARLREAYDELLERRVEAAGDRLLGGVTRQIMFPSQAHPAFARNAVVAAGIELGRALLGSPEVHRSFDMLIFKPPGHPEPTPWHQDAAYARSPFAPAGTPITLESIQFWVALDDADEENGCMHFAPGHHTKPLLPHRVASGDPEDDGRLLEIVDPELQLALDRAVACPLGAGGCTLHSYGTPHYTPPNRSVDRPRRAYIFNVATPRGIRFLLGLPDAD